jgi:hypothetical protein
MDCATKQNKNFVCTACDKILSSKQRLNTHQEKCEKYKKYLEENNYIDLLEEKIMIIEELEERIKVLEHQINNTEPKSVHVSVTDKLTLNDVASGPSFLANFAVEHAFDNSLICTDYARRLFKYKNEKGAIIKDPLITNLGKKFFQTIAHRAETLLNNEIDRLNGKDDDELCIDLLQQKIRIKKCASTTNTKYFNNFVKHLSRMTYSKV